MRKFAMFPLIKLAKKLKEEEKRAIFALIRFH